MKLYLMRSARYGLRMAIIIGIAFVVLYFAGLLDTGGQGLARALFASRNGLILLLALVLLALAYPKFSFGSVEIRGNMQSERKAIIDAFASYGYSLKKESDKGMVFRADSTAKKILAQWDDAINVTTEGEFISLEGLKKDIFRVEVRLKPLLDA